MDKKHSARIPRADNHSGIPGIHGNGKTSADCRCIFTNRAATVLYITLNVLREAVRAAREMMIEEILPPLLVYVAIKHPPNLARGRGTR